MHRNLRITVPFSVTDKLCGDLIALENVIGLSVVRQASLKPVGDVITVQVLNRGADEVLRCVGDATRGRHFSVATSELASLTDSEQGDAINNDVDEAIWEEMECGLRHQAHVTPNFLALMALGGAIAAVGLVSEPVPQAIAFTASAIIAPGFEPLTKIPLGIVLRSWSVFRRGITATFVGYAVLIAAAALTMLVLLGASAVTAQEFVGNSQVKAIIDPDLKNIVVPICGALAGAVMFAAYRRSVIAGPLVVLMTIPAAAIIGASIATGQMDFLRGGLMRFGLDALFIIGAGIVVFWLKQALVHRRKPLS